MHVLQDIVYMIVVEFMDHLKKHRYRRFIVRNDSGGHTSIRTAAGTM